MHSSVTVLIEGVVQVEITNDPFVDPGFHILLVILVRAPRGVL